MSFHDRQQKERFLITLGECRKCDRRKRNADVVVSKKEQGKMASLNSRPHGAGACPIYRRLAWRSSVNCFLAKIVQAFSLNAETLLSFV